MLASSLPVAHCRTVTEPVDWNAIEQLPLVDTITSGLPKQGTIVQIARTDTHWHIRFVVEDREIRATMTERDSPLYKEEVVEIFFDPWGDGIAYFEIELNPLNTVCDLLVRRSRVGRVKNFSWDCGGLETRVVPTPEGWHGELSIPFESVVERPPEIGERWRVNFYRIDRPAGEAAELSAWSPTGRPHFHVESRFGWVEF